MEQGLDHFLSAVWLVFGGTYLNHTNALKCLPDHREQSLVDLLCSHLKDELASPTIKLLHDLELQTQLIPVCKLLQLWSQDLDIIYKIREGQSSDLEKLKVEKLAERFLKRVSSFYDCTIIPNGLISKCHADVERAESVSLAILKKNQDLIDWVQVDPGSAYHQHCKHVAGEKCNAFLEILEVNPHNITKDWLCLLVDLKAVSLNDESSSYRDMSLYEGLLSHLNGKTVFQAKPDEDFIVYSHPSPAHTWQVINQSFRYLLRHFLGDMYQVVYQHILTNFKLCLMEKTLDAYQNQDANHEQREQLHFLLQEICSDVAQQALDQGSEEQKASSLQLINKVKSVLEEHRRLLKKVVCHDSQLLKPHIRSLEFATPPLKDYTLSHSDVTSEKVQVDPVIQMRSMHEDIIDYLKRLKHNCIDKLISATDINGTASLSCSIEAFFIDYLANTDILEASTYTPFSRDDLYLARTLAELAGIYYGCQSRLVTNFLSNGTYEPHHYAKNVTIQFFVYAVVAALNYRDPNIGPLLATYNLSVAVKALALDSIIPQLVLEDCRWVKVLLATQAFFAPKNDHRATLFSSEFTFEVKNDGDKKNTEVGFAYQLLQKFPSDFKKFTDAYRDLEDENLHSKWATLAYTDTFLPYIYSLLYKVANFAKVSLTGFPPSTNCHRITTYWRIFKKIWEAKEQKMRRKMRKSKYYVASKIVFRINKTNVSTEYCSDILTSYLIKSNNDSRKDPYQTLITCKEKESEGSVSIHFLENEIIANQSEKLITMDFNRYIQLGFLQSEAQIKLERLYIALKEKQLNFSCKQEAVLIKQTLFEISLLVNTKGEFSSLLDWTAHCNLTLIHRFGLLCIERARTMKYRLSEHHAIGDILIVSLGLLTFYPTLFRDTFIEDIIDIYRLLKAIVAQPPAYLSDNILLHLNAYLLIAIQAKPQLLETDTLTVLKALVAIQYYNVKGIKLDNSWSLRVATASFSWCSRIESQLALEPALLHDLMSSVIPEWKQTGAWYKVNAGLLYLFRDYAIKPLIGCIYFKSQPIMGMPDTITGHHVFKEYSREMSFPVIAASHRTNNKQYLPCYLSINRTPQIRLTLVGSDLMIEENIQNQYQRFIPVQELLGHGSYPNLLFESPNNGQKLRHWLDSDRNILIKNEEQCVLFKWDLCTDLLFSFLHNGYIVPWEQVKESFFKTRLECFELPYWIELIVQQSPHSANIQIESLNFPRLGLQFSYQQGKFLSKQVHGYVIAEQQYLNTLQGFYSYLVLELKEHNSIRKQVKVIIPHRKVTPEGPFYANRTTVNCCEVRSPPFFVYDYDFKMGFLRGHHIRAHLYLALLYFRSASLDDNNGYYLARENLELCWKEEPFNSIELDIIEQLLNVSAVHQRGLHSNLVALYLKVVSLLSNSLRLAFLFTDKTAEQNKRRSDQLLERCRMEAPHFSLIYLQNKSNIFARIQLSPEEEKDALKYCTHKEENLSVAISLEEGEDAVKHCSKAFMPVVQKFYNSHYQVFFSKQALIATKFRRCFNKHFSDFILTHDNRGINFSSGIKGIRRDRFRLVHFITLYNLAKTSAVSIEKYRYLLYHLLLRARIDYSSVEATLVMMLARALLLVAENPSSFPNSPSWFNKSIKSVNLAKRQLEKAELFHAFPSFNWTHRNHFDYERNHQAEIKAMEENNKENEEIWSCLVMHDLDVLGAPLCLPKNPDNFTLQCEHWFTFSNVSKKTVVKEHYLQAAYSNSMYQFFSSVFYKCDKLKFSSGMGWTVVPFIHNTINVTFVKNEDFSLPASESVSLEEWTIAQEPLIDFVKFFVVNPLPAENIEFLFESHLEEQNGYQQQFYRELRDSWIVYTGEAKCSYSWLNTQSVNELESVLQEKYEEMDNQAKQIWNRIEVQFKQRSNSESNNYFALRWYSGQVRHYLKHDLLRLLIEPNKIADYNPDCVSKADSIIQDLLQYVTHEINSAKIVRVLALTEQYKQAQKETERFFILQRLVKNLQENLDRMSYRYPHWLLFQFENEIIVRDNQRELIVAMLNQTEKAMYQLNMGEGKSSVILPLLSCSLANTQQLLRINVLPALLATMKEFLRLRFSGLIRKHVYILPFNRDTDISTKHLKLIFETLQTCKDSQHILLTTPEHRLCLQLKFRELMLENQEKNTVTNVFNWATYRQRANAKMKVYNNLSEYEMIQLLKEQDRRLKTCLRNERYIDSDNCILKIPRRGQGHKEFARFINIINDSKFREWSCLKAAYKELQHNSTHVYEDHTKKSAILHKIDAITAIDLLDESDEILKHGTELNYTVGDNHMFAGGELRWEIPQFFINAIFCDSELKNIITEGKASGSTVFKPHFSLQGGVPFIQLLDESYFENQIKPLLLSKFFQKISYTLRKYHCSADNPLVQGESSSLRDYIAGKLSPNVEKKVVQALTYKGSLKDKVLIAKGWLSHGILFHVFNAKYRVQFGLNLSSSKQIAVPFFGKDSPSPRSEFSHPDVMLGFTIISYLYQGLNQEQIKETLNKLKDKYSHQVADAQLSSWAEAGRDWIIKQTDEFPPFLLTSLQHIDLEEEQCLSQVHQYLSGNYMAIFFYLNQLVLLEEAMQYLYKISANAHSLVGYNAALGFSGTDDRKITMPFEITSLRSTTQEGTNGKLLFVLTQIRNSNYYSIQAEDTVNFLKKLCEYAGERQDCHALIDAGALVTGFSNYAVAEFLLDHLPSKFLGILYFNDEGNSLTVLTRDKNTIALQDCFLDKQCLFAYLDDIHTRGTDIELPYDCHAILTISMSMEKDKLMQAAMRLRQLAQKQSISLWGTQGVTLAIKRDNNLPDSVSIKSREVIKWVTGNTVDHINADLFPVAVRKINFHFLKKAEALLKEAPTKLNSLEQFCKEKVLFHLEEFYAVSPQIENLADRLRQFVVVRLKTFWEKLEKELKMKQLSGTIFGERVLNEVDKAAFQNLLFAVCEELLPYLQSGLVRDSLDNDEEKEVEIEIQVEETVLQEAIISVESRAVYLEDHWNTRLILCTDFIQKAEQKKIIIPLSRLKDFIQIPVNIKHIIWHKDIYMTANFLSTVKFSRKKMLDNYLRPVDVILVHRCANKSIAVLLSGQEAALIKSTCYQELDFNLLVHINDIDGPTQLPVGSSISKKEQKLLTIVKLFSGECNYASIEEVHHIAKCVGRIPPCYFTCLNVSNDFSEKLFKILVQEEFLDFAGVMTEKLLAVLREIDSVKVKRNHNIYSILISSKQSLSLNLPDEYEVYNKPVLGKLHGVFLKLIIDPLCSLKSGHGILREWVGTRGKLREYFGSALESVLNPEYEPRCSK